MEYGIDGNYMWMETSTSLLTHLGEEFRPASVLEIFFEEGLAELELDAMDAADARAFTLIICKWLQRNGMDYDQASAISWPMREEMIEAVEQY